MPKSKRGTSPGTRKAVAAANLRRKINRLKEELATLSRENSDRLLAQSPLLLQTIFYLQGIEDDRAIELASQLQSLLLEQAYREAP